MTHQTEISASVGLSGMFKLSIENGDGSVTETDWFDNVVTDQGLNAMGTQRAIHCCQVGTGVSPSPSTTSASLQTFRARAASTNYSGVRTAGGTGTIPDPYWAANEFSFTFAKGVTSGTLTEIGIDFYINNISNAQPPVDKLFSHALIPGGVVIAANSILTVTYKIKAFLPVDDIVNVVGGYTCTIRPSNLLATDSFMYAQSTYGFNSVWGVHARSNTQIYTTPIGAITEKPSGTGSPYNNNLSPTYVNNSYEQTCTFRWNASGSGVLTNVQSAWWPWSIGNWQVEFNPAIPVDRYTQDLTLSMTVKWGRYPLP